MKQKYFIISLLFSIVAFTSCKDTWEEHYNESNSIKSDLNLYDYIKSQSDLSTFSEMLDIAGFDSILNKPQTYTVWVPVNAALESVNLNDTTLVVSIVRNHISRFSYSTSDIVSKTIYMLDKKFLNFSLLGAGYIFGGKNLIQTDIATDNGIIHTLDGYIPYLSNIWEFIGRTEGLDSLKAYLYSQSTSVFDEAASVEIGTNEFNQAVYDSVIIFSNPILDKIGYLQTEDSLFAAILPNNTAWTKVYNQVESKYKTLDSEGGAPQQRLNTQYAIVENLIFKFKDLPIDPTSYDSLRTTTGTLFKPSSDLFIGSTKHTLSNGVAYLADSLRFKASESWQKPIVVEAENSSYGRSFSYSSLFVRSSLGTSFETSDDKYLVSEALTVSRTTPNSVTFPIPNTLSGKYKVYAVFVPSSIVLETDERTYKVRFAFSYIDSNAVQKNDLAINSKNGIATTPGSIGASFETKSDSITKMFVTEIDFPYCNIYDEESSISDISVRLKVENAALITELAKYDRTLRIDYIILEPVE